MNENDCKFTVRPILIIRCNFEIQNHLFNSWHYYEDLEEKIQIKRDKLKYDLINYSFMIIWICCFNGNHFYNKFLLKISPFILLALDYIKSISINQSL